MPTTPYTTPDFLPPTEFSASVQELRLAARSAFTAAITELNTARTALTQATTDANRKAAQERMKAAQGLVASCVGQATQVETMDSEQAGRCGYAAAVELMRETAKTAAVLCSQVRQLAAIDSPTTGATTTYDVNERIAAIAGAITAVARLSPLPLWQQGLTMDTQAH
jgi:hypothetical protein